MTDSFIKKRVRAQLSRQHYHCKSWQQGWCPTGSLQLSSTQVQLSPGQCLQWMLVQTHVCVLTEERMRSAGVVTWLLWRDATETSLQHANKAHLQNIYPRQLTELRKLFFSTTSLRRACTLHYPQACALSEQHPLLSKLLAAYLPSNGGCFTALGVTEARLPPPICGNCKNK